MTVWSHGNLRAEEVREGEFWINPYIPKQSVVFLWGDTSIGKSPLTWRMAQAVASGRGFFGLQSQAGKVLYLEVDTAAVVNVPRIQKLHAGEDPELDRNLIWVFDEAFSVPQLGMRSETRQRLEQLHNEHTPDVVFVNTVRKIHPFDDKDSKTPSVVYGFFRETFPEASVVLVHHERKRSTDPNARHHDQESFSGSKAWINDATVGLHLQRHRQVGGKANLRLIHWKSQASPKVKDLPLRLEPDGTNLNCHYYEEYLQIYEALNLDAGQKERRVFDRELAQQLEISEVSVRRKRLDIEKGRWPGRAWLGGKEKGQEETEEEEGA